MQRVVVHVVVISNVERRPRLGVQPVRNWARTRRIECVVIDDRPSEVRLRELISSPPGPDVDIKCSQTRIVPHEALLIQTYRSAKLIRRLESDAASNLQKLACAGPCGAIHPGSLHRCRHWGRCRCTDLPLPTLSSSLPGGLAWGISVQITEIKVQVVVTISNLSVELNLLVEVRAKVARDVMFHHRPFVSSPLKARA